MNIDPTKMELTQDEFIAICGAGLQSYMSVGAIITLHNSYCNQYEVIDVNHDGTLNTVDIMAHTQVAKMHFDEGTRYYNDSESRTWINSTFIDAFDYDVRELMKTQEVMTAGVTNNDKAKLLSWRELGITYDSRLMQETDGGNKYPVFTAGTYNTNIPDRWRPAGNYGSDTDYWLRSRYTSGNYNIWAISSSGLSTAYNANTTRYGILPVLRF